jgi:hypothetical protein
MLINVFFLCFFWLHIFLQNNIETYVYLGICLQILRLKRQKTPEVSIAKYVTLYAVNRVILIDIVLLGNIKRLQSLQLKILNQKETIHAVIAVNNIHQEWVYGNIPKNVPVKHRSNLMN